MPHPGSLEQLSPLMTSIYRTLYPTGDGSHAADELRAATEDPWTALRMSRLIVKHESEWANPNKWQPLIAAIEQRTGPQAQHMEELKRIEKLVWWEEVKAKLTDLPAPEVFHIHPIGLVGNFAQQGVMLEEARLRAFLRVIRQGEGTSKDIGYRTLYGGGTFDSFADHPRKTVTAGNYTSTAAGAYQILSQTWDGLVRTMGFRDFSPENQDRAAVQLLRHRKALDPILKGDIETAIKGHGPKNEGSNKEWASQPESPYGQPTMKMSDAKILFNEFLEQEKMA